MAEKQQADAFAKRETIKDETMSYLEVKATVRHCNDIIGLLGYTDCTNLFFALELKDEEIENAKRRDDPDVVMTVVARRVLNDGLRKKYPERATIGAIIQGLGDARNNAAKEEFEELWIKQGGRKASEKFKDSDIDKLSAKIPPNGLKRLYHAMELEDDEIDVAMGDANRADVEQKCMNVLSFLKRTYPKKAKLGNILNALKEAKNIDHMQQLQEKWKDEGKPDLK